MDFAIRDWSGLERTDYIESQLIRANGLEYGWLERKVTAIGAVGCKTVLDLACGIGHWSVVLAAHNRRVVATDSNFQQMQVLRRLLAERGISNVQPMRALMRAIPLSDGSMDYVICFNSMMFSSPRLVLSEIHRVLRPGGRVFIHVNSKPLWARYCLRNARQGHWGNLRGGLMAMGLWPTPPDHEPENFCVFPTTHRVISTIWSGLGGKMIAFGPDGSVGTASPEPRQPHFTKDLRWMGLELRHEFLLEKRA